MNPTSRLLLRCGLLIALVVIAAIIAFGAVTERRQNTFIDARDSHTPQKRGKQSQQSPQAQQLSQAQQTHTETGEDVLSFLQRLRDEVESGHTRSQALAVLFGEAPSAAVDQTRESLEVWLTPHIDQLCSRSSQSDRRLLASQLALVFSICEESGSPLIPQIDALAASQAYRQKIRSKRERILAVPRATVKLFAFLPFIFLFGGSLIGANPIAFLFSSMGAVCLLIGSGFICIGLVWYRKVIADYEKSENADQSSGNPGGMPAALGNGLLGANRRGKGH